MFKKIYIFLIASILLVGVNVSAGSLTPLLPTPYTLSDLYSKISSSTYAYTPQVFDINSGPASTFLTLTEIWNAISWKTLNNSGVIDAGFYATSSLEIIEPNLVAAKIASGTTMFGITGTCQGISDSVLGGIAAYYPLDSDTDDYSGNGNNGTSVGATASTSGKVNTAYDFNGVGDYINIGANKFDNLHNSSIVFWYNSLGWTNYFQNIFEHYASDNTRISVTMGFGSGNDHVLMCSVVVGGGVQAGGITTDTNCSSEQCFDVWHQGVCQFGDEGMKIYVDGVQGFSDPSYTNSFSNVNSSSNHIGRSMFSPISAGGRDYFKGPIDEVIIYDRILSEAEILYLYNNGSGQSLLQ